MDLCRKMKIKHEAEAEKHLEELAKQWVVGESPQQHFRTTQKAEDYIYKLAHENPDGNSRWGGRENYLRGYYHAKKHEFMGKKEEVVDYT